MIATDVEPKTRLWTRSEYYSMADIGLFEGQRVELIEGEIVVMSPQDFSHTSSVAAVANAIRKAFGTGYWTREEKPLRLGENSELEPDVSVVPGAIRDYDDHPTTAILVVEVSGSSLKNDRTRKAALYAKAGIADYWIINLWGRCVEIYRNPKQDAAGQFSYELAGTFASDAVISPLLIPESKIAVADLLPPEKLMRNPSDSSSNDELK